MEDSRKPLPEEAQKQVAQMIASTDLKVMVVELSLDQGFKDNLELGEVVGMAFRALKQDIIVMQSILRGIVDPSSIERSAEDRARAAGETS